MGGSENKQIVPLSALRGVVAAPSDSCTSRGTWQQHSTATLYLTACRAAAAAAAVSQHCDLWDSFYALLTALIVVLTSLRGRGLSLRLRGLHSLVYRTSI